MRSPARWKACCGGAEAERVGAMPTPENTEPLTAERPAGVGWPKQKKRHHLPGEAPQDRCIPPLQRPGCIQPTDPAGFQFCLPPPPISQRILVAPSRAASRRACPPAWPGQPRFHPFPQDAALQLGVRDREVVQHRASPKGLVVSSHGSW